MIPNMSFDTDLKTLQGTRAYISCNNSLSHWKQTDSGRAAR